MTSEPLRQNIRQRTGQGRRLELRKTRFCSSRKACLLWALLRIFITAVMIPLIINRDFERNA